MTDIPVTGAIADYRGRHLRIVFSGEDWVALRAAPGPGVPDGFESGESPVGQGHTAPWVKVPRSALNGIVRLRVTAKIAGHEVTLRREMPDGRIQVSFLGSSAVAQEIGLEGNQYEGWSGLYPPEALQDIEIEEY